MGFNKSEKAILRVKRYLDDMLSGQHTVSWPSSAPRKLQRMIYDGMHAVEGKKEYNLYWNLRLWYRIRVKDGYVEAEWRGVGIIPSLPGIADDIPRTTIVPVETREFKDIGTAEGIVGVVISYNHQCNEMYFPDAIELSDHELNTIYIWLSKEHPEWKLINQVDHGVTVTKRDVNPIYYWHPPEELQ